MGRAGPVPARPAAMSDAPGLLTPAAFGCSKRTGSTASGS
eukprot:CAMPEP_0179271172 /NCGR_PEP_ID=MMETSP0797-20121207/31838_1 /TAXON_ID=47934 /ORGANISM="Dinophysis acuminata, Strain DAEP01" /LENGTH=39 /DNA_ID= /DNA_START= /DNA_END= /DNA_ORIENTATION=